MTQQPAAVSVNGHPIRWDSIDGHRFAGRFGGYYVVIQHLWGIDVERDGDARRQLTHVVHEAASAEEAANALGEAMACG